jgi:hypothetical protein
VYENPPALEPPAIVLLPSETSTNGSAS